MASFLQHVAARLKDTAQKFYQRISSPANPVAGDSIPEDNNPVITGVNKYIGSLPPQTVTNATRVSNERLLSQDGPVTISSNEASLHVIRKKTEERLQTILNLYSNGSLTIEDMQTAFEETIRRSALAAAVIGVRGIGNLTENVVEAVQREISGVLNKFDEDIRVATQDYEISPGSEKRLMQYANIPHMISQRALQQSMLDEIKDISKIEERRVLSGGDSCDICIELAGQGWQGAGELPPIGSDTYCQWNCRCYIETRIIED